MNFSECWSLHFIVIPAFHHEVVDLFRTVRWLREIVVAPASVESIGTHLKDLFVREGRERLLACKCQDLPERHSKRPGVTLAGEFVLETNHL